MVGAPALLALLLGRCAAGPFRPATMRYADLAAGAGGAGDEALERALVEDGLLQVAEVPGFPGLREEALREAQACLAVAPLAREHLFPDGTLRRTLAAAAGPAGRGPLEHGSDAPACRRLERAGGALREAVGAALALFTGRLAGLLDVGRAEHVLRREGGGSYDALQQLVAAGDRLEHFHSYRLPAGAAGAPGPPATLGFHVDQGLFIAFVPALLLAPAAAGAAEAGAGGAPAAGAFVLRTAAGEELEAEFRGDALVFLLGDGVNQYLNKVRRSAPLRAPTHALRLAGRGGAGQQRLWYGLMQLPPADAVSEAAGTTYGQLRGELIRASAAGGPAAEKILALGCSSRRLEAHEVSPECNATQLLCWMRCMDFTAEANPEACAAQQMGFNCTSQFDQIYRPQNSHGDYRPQCTNSTSFVTPRPPVLQLPAGNCSGFPALVADAAYGRRVALVPGELYLLWNVVGGQLQAKLLSKGRVGWLAVGLEGPPGLGLAMLGGNVVLGLNDPVAGPSLGEYRIHAKTTAFRAWTTPLSPSALSDAAVSFGDCAASLAFRTASIHGVPLNLTGGRNPRLIWARTQRDYPTRDRGGYAGYHSDAAGNGSTVGRFRGVVALDFLRDGAGDGALQANAASGGARPLLPLLLLLLPQLLRLRPAAAGPAPAPAA